VSTVDSVGKQETCFPEQFSFRVTQSVVTILTFECLLFTRSISKAASKESVSSYYEIYETYKCTKVSEITNM
jgi:hypothetical protein